MKTILKEEIPMITPTMSIGEVLRMSRETAPIFMSFGMHCLTCPHATAESLAEACAAHGVSVDELVAKLNAFFAEKK